MTTREAGARARKVAAIVELVPVAARRVENECYAREMLSWDDAQRARWSYAATGSTRPPSALTWYLAVQGVRARLTGEDVLAAERAGAA